MSKFETIVAPVTPCFNSPVGIVRVSGPLSIGVASKICAIDLIPRYASYCVFKTLNSVEFDRGIVIFFKGPNSFTGEDVIEFHCHGGLGVIDILIEACLNYETSNGSIRLAQPGEFSKRAFLNNKINLIEAEAIAEMINASTSDAVKAINNSLSGNFGVMLDRLFDMILSVRAELEAKIDFVEDNLGPIEIKLFFKNLQEIKLLICKCLEFAENGKQLNFIGKIVLLGTTNVGKSSILNFFSMKDSAIVSTYKGTTRDVVREVIKIDDQIKLQICDTAGIRETYDEVEREGVKRAWNEIEDADCLLYVCDITNGFLEEQISIRNKVKNKINRENINFITVFNKIDKLEEDYLEDYANKLQNFDFLISAKTGEGFDCLKKELIKIFSNQKVLNFKESFIVSKRIESNLADSLINIERAISNIHKNQLDLCAEDLKNTHVAIKAITGEDLPDDILDRIFSTFCIGK